MFASKQRPFALTLLISVVVALALVSAADANSVNRRDHVSLNRIVKKRSPQGGLLTPIGAAEDPAEGGGQSVSASAAAPSASASAPAAPSAPSASAPAPETPSASAPSSAPAASESANSASQPSASGSAVPSQSAVSDTPPADPTPNADPNPGPAANTPPTSSQKPRGATTILHIETEQVSQQADAQKTGASSAGKTTAVVFVAIIGAVAGVTVIWTIFRKWRLARSSKFDARMNPIDWEPSNADANSHRHSTASSFHSSGHGHYGATTANPHIPEHDFTAGPAHLAPVGGYADLSRGPSPQPSMHEINRGPSPSMGHYGAQPGYGTQDYYDTGRRF